MGATPQLPRDDFGKYLRELERRLAIVEQRNPFANTGLSCPVAGTTQVDGNLVVQGNFTAVGKINNDALTNPVEPDAPYGYRQNFGLTTTLSNIYTLNVPVPAGFTKAAVSITASVYAVNPNTTGGSNGTGGDYLYVQANINGYNGFALPLGISGSNGSGTNRSPFSTVLGGLSAGGSVSLQVAASTGFAAFAANTNNTAEITGSIGWFR